MWSINKKATNEHRKHKRILEAQLIIDAIRQLPEMNNKVNAENKILEFGTGDGFQIPYLQTLGHVIASDIYISESINTNHESIIAQCSICETPFNANSFDLIFSNQVIEHIKDLNSAFQELKRIGKVDCIYAFSVPTVWWLLLTIPTHYLSILTRVLARLLGCITGGTTRLSDVLEERRLGTDRNTERTNKNIWAKFLRSIQPGGHGCWGRRRFGFFQCWWHFRVAGWKALFQNNGFRILRIEPLLLYSISEWPVVPTTRLPAKYGLCSSVLFLMERVVKNKEMSELT